MLPIPGTGSLEHLKENVAASSISLSNEEYSRLVKYLGDKPRGFPVLGLHCTQAGEFNSPDLPREGVGWN